MYLKSLTLKGFKSFAKPTTFEFEPGVTAVVGPNGSGKSNVVDALAWVMGEQGAKSLRGGKMEDVIFAGTSERGPLGRAEVKLTIDNSDGALPIDYTEVTISRTLFRSGASEYAINGESCRLLDVQELLSDSGLGSQMHSIVGQGQLDTVLRATAEDRRAFIEEAAGILKHRKRKERTLRKLEAMETNLTRLSDLAAEVRRQLKPLGRQAEVAKKAQHIAANLRDAKARVLADDVNKLRKEIKELTQDDSTRNTEKIVLKEQQEQKRLRIQKIESEQHHDLVDSARRTTLELERVQGKLRGLYEQVQQRLTFLASQTDTVPAVNLLSKQNVRDAEEELAALEGHLPREELAWREAFNKTRETQKQLDAVDENIAAQSALLNKHDLNLSNLRGKVSAARQKYEVLKQEKSRRETAETAANERFLQASENLASFESEDAPDQGSSQEFEKLYQDAQAKRAKLRERIDTVRDELHSEEREKSGFEAKLSALNSAIDFGDEAQELQAKTLGRVAEHVKAAPGFELAVEAALGGVAEAFLVENSDAALELIKEAKNLELGRVRLVIAEAANTYEGSFDPERLADELGFQSLHAMVDAPPGLQNLFLASFVADTVDHALSSLHSYSKHQNGGSPITVVTKDGEKVAGSLVEAGSGESVSKIKLLAERDSAEENFVHSHEAALKLQAALEELKKEDVNLKATEAESLNRLRESDAKQAEKQKEHNRLTTQKEAAEAELQRNSASLKVFIESLTEAKKVLAESERVLLEAQQQPKPFFDPTARDSVVLELEALRAEEVRHRIALETLKERIRAQKEQKASLEKQLAVQRKAQEEAARKEVLRLRQVAKSKQIANLLPQIIDACDFSLNEARVKQKETENERAAVNQELVLVRAEEAELREKLNRLTEYSHSIEMKAYERKIALSALLERSGEELGLVEEVLLAEYGPEVPIEELDRETGEKVTFDFDRGEQQRKLKEAEGQLRELGRINPLALEEFAALEKRHLFLTQQLDDLNNTKKDLLAIIADLDQKMEGIFEDAFNDTKQAFETVFPILFPGGVGDIFLTDPQNMLTTGIEVSVRPAGKKIERLSLLSGGERSLAAVAWLVAIFKARPSPFYIMDEVEAALDDANLGRLLQVFEELRETSQLIVITHQKRTMEIADALYGVSMRGDGISVVVGQRISDKE